MADGKISLNTYIEDNIRSSLVIESADKKVVPSNLEIYDRETDERYKLFIDERDTDSSFLLLLPCGNRHNRYFLRIYHMDVKKCNVDMRRIKEAPKPADTIKQKYLSELVEMGLACYDSRENFEKSGFEVFFPEGIRLPLYISGSKKKPDFYAIAGLNDYEHENVVFMEPSTFTELTEKNQIQLLKRSKEKNGYF